MDSKAKLLVISLLLCSSLTHALTLGRLRGAALVGQRLDVTVPVQVDAGDDLSSLCLEAEVFHADTRQDPARVRVSVESAGTPAAQVRIQSSAPVDEPIVTVYLHAGCSQKLSRRYVLLADVASDVQPPAAPPLVRPELVRDAPRAEGPRAEPARAEAAAPVASASAVAPAKPRPVSPPAVSAAARPKAERAKQVAGKSSVLAAPAVRLKLDPLEYFSDRVGKLDSAALLAQAAQATPDAQKMQKLEGDVKALQAVAKKSEASLAEMRRQLELTQQQAYPAELVYGLGLTTLLGVLAAAGLWWRGRRAQAKDSEWWDAQGPVADQDAPATVMATSPAVVAPLAPEVSAGEPEPVPQVEAGLSQTAELSSFLKGLEAPSEVDVSLVDMSESTFDLLLKSSEPASLQTSVASLRASLPGGEPVRRSVSPAEVSDVRQKAEFFITLGQTEQAVQTLQYCIAESELPHPAVYLDLLALLHSLSEKTEFGLLGDACEHLFNLEMPEFAKFGQESRGLETYPDILLSLCAQWPGSGVRPLIDSHLFRDPHGPMVQSLELGAFRDLMLLADIASDLLDSGDPAWAGEPAAADAALDDVDLPLDFDLDLPLPVASAAAPESLERPGNLIDFDLDDLPKSRQA